MATSLKNLSTHSDKNLTSYKDVNIGIVVSEWNDTITEALYEGAYQCLIKQGVLKENIYRIDVPGTFELTLGAQFLAQKIDIDAVIALGCVIQGETRHFDFICSASAQGITDVGLKYNKPVIFGVLTPNTMQQALDRAGGKHGNKGDEAAITALKMISISRKFN